ncbi:hypothetical protein [Spirosoma sordidisoli]|uniref:Uncharacterized protein n=1 Tax=Spirosoma sordidisoli TaxID=2502893 RepID=A0A4Q2USH7_9BACT|nr:hypothetical protein [Spirosoma sordidisoli]RYC70715.1 hypothetical protein EQG79_00755 [Spirosoma sordidisoli]
MNNIAREIALTLAILSTSTQQRALVRRELNETPKPTEEQIQEKLNTAKGLKKFCINGKTVWARDEKNAIRKAKR